MKNIYFLFLSFFLFVSCSSDIVSPDVYGEAGIVSIDLTIPALDDMKTRAYADGSTVKHLKCYLYDHDAGENALPFSIQDIEIKNTGSKRGGRFDITLVKDKTYDLVFLATAVDQTDPDSKVYYNPTLRTLNVNYAASKTNDEEMDCFFGVLPDISADSDKVQTITLRRPFAQLNIGTKDLADYNKMATSSIKTVGVSVDGVFSSMNVMDGKVIGSPVKAVFKPNSLPSGETFPVNDCEYLSMDYLLVNERKNVSVTMTANNGEYNLDNKFSDVPIQRNCQTNIYGDLLTKKNNFKVEIVTDFTGSENKNMNDKWADYDLVLQTIEKPISIPQNWLSLYLTYDDGSEKIIDLSRYLDDTNTIKLTWKELNISDNLIGMRFYSHNGTNYIESPLKSLHKCNINPLNLEDISLFFVNCVFLEELEAIKTWNTSSIQNMRETFGNCRNLQSLDLSNFDTSIVRDMSWMFNHCSSLSSLDVSKFDTSNVTNMHAMFNNCSSLPTLDVTKFNTSNVTNMSWMFGNCSSLTTLDVTKFNTSNVTDMSWMFGYCRSLPTLDVTKFNTSNVTDMEGMFGYCNSLTTLDVTKFNTSNVTDMSAMFSYCYSLPTLDVTKFITSNVTDMSSMFDLCSGLTALDVTKFNTSNVTNMRKMFNECSSLSSLDVSNFNTSNVTDMSWMFQNCCNIPDLDVSKFNTPNVTDMSWMFQNCKKLNTIDLSKCNACNVIYMDQMFYKCDNIGTINLSDMNAINLKSMNKIFYGCNNLIDLNLSNFYFSNFDSAGKTYMWLNCSKLVNIKGPVHNIKNSLSLNNAPLLSDESIAVFVNALEVNTNTIKPVLHLYSGSNYNIFQKDIEDKGWNLGISG